MIKHVEVGKMKICMKKRLRKRVVSSLAQNVQKSHLKKSEKDFLFRIFYIFIKMFLCIILLCYSCWASLTPQQATDAFLTTLDSELKQSFKQTVGKLQPILDQQPPLSSQIFTDLEPKLIQGFKPLAIQLFNSHEVSPVSSNSFILQDPIHSELTTKWNQYSKAEIKKWVYNHMQPEHSMNLEQPGHVLHLASIVGVITITVTFLVAAAAATLGLMTGMIVMWYKAKGVPIPGTKEAKEHQRTNLNPDKPETYAEMKTKMKDHSVKTHAHPLSQHRLRRTSSLSKLHVRRDYLPL